jgi:Fur family transcriptional regulator, ferric uptake regulator
MKINELKEKLKNSGYKLTPQRKAILDVILDNKGKHLSVEEIYDIVKVSHSEIGLATVYRTVTLFCELSLLSKLNLEDNCIRYELYINDEDHHHHHLICNACGIVIEVSDDSLDELEKRIEDEFDFSIDDHTLKFYGLCSNCKNKNKKK